MVLLEFAGESVRTTISPSRVDISSGRIMLDKIKSYILARLAEDSTKRGEAAILTALAAWVVSPNDAALQHGVLTAVAGLAVTMILVPTNGGK
jgi:hypothetical protein